MKVDIEGAEVPLFQTSSDELLRRIKQITIEFHNDNHLISAEQFRAILARLKSLGFVGIQFAGNDTNWLFFRPQDVRIGPGQTAYIRWVVRNVRGALRKLGFRNN
jgi:hypothetical protein